jgi:hypothetical protein
MTDLETYCFVKKKSPKGEANPQYKPYLPSGAEKVACHLRTKKLPAAGRRRLPAKQSRICERSHCCSFLFFFGVVLLLLCVCCAFLFTCHGATYSQRSGTQIPLNFTTQFPTPTLPSRIHTNQSLAPTKPTPRNSSQLVLITHTYPHTHTFSHNGGRTAP